MARSTSGSRLQASLSPRPALMAPREFEAYQLFMLVEAGVDCVRLHASQEPGTPWECRETHGFVMAADDAMRLAPIPHELPPGRVCHCTYRPALG